MQKNYFFILLIPYLLSACGNSSSSGSKPGENNPDINKPTTTKQIEPGTNLTFTCVDTFNETTVILYSLWNSSSSSWNVSLSEYDKNGTKINEQNGLIGSPHPIQEWQMNIKNGAQNFAQISQDGVDQATFYGATRNMDCKFE